MRGRVYFPFLAFVLVSSSVFSVVALSKSNHKFLDKIVSRADETVKSIESIFHKKIVNDSNAAQPKQWAVLVAGSNGYYNYRHQVYAFFFAIFI